jgi:hypothetical protein
MALRWRALLQDADGGHVSQRLRQALAGCGHRVSAVVEQVQPADRLVARPQRQRHDSPETGRHRHWAHLKWAGTANRQGHRRCAAEISYARPPGDDRKD